MKSLYSLCLCLVFCCSLGLANDSPKMITLAPGDQLLITVQDAEPASLAPAVSVLREPVYETVYEQVCVDGVCRLQPVRRLVNRTANVLQAVARPVVMAAAGGCGCNCAGCNCAPMATMATMATMVASPVQYAVETRHRVRATRTIRAPLQTFLQNRRN